MTWLLEDRSLLPPPRFLDSAYGLPRNDNLYHSRTKNRWGGRVGGSICVHLRDLRFLHGRVGGTF